MSKRYFKINTGAYGGEITCGEVTPEFYDYWIDRDDTDLIDAMFSDGEGFEDSPKPRVDDEDYWSAWHELDNFHHGSAPYADNTYRVTEISLKSGVTYDAEYGEFEGGPDGYDYFDELTDWEDQTNLDYIQIASQELYGNRDKLGHKDCVPVLFFHSAEKGSFGDVVVVTDGADFNPAKFRVDVIETDIGEFIESYWYDKKQLPVNYDWCDSRGKGTYCYLSVLDTSDHAKWFKPLSEDMAELSEYWEADEDVL